MSLDLSQTIIAAYGSLDRPNWSFMDVRLKQGMHDRILRELVEVGSVIETTDLNDDHSRCLAVSSKNTSYALRLSLIGEFACVFDDDTHVFSEADLLASSLGRRILNVLKSNGMEILSAQKLKETMEFAGKLQTLYYVLFSSDELIF